MRIVIDLQGAQAENRLRGIGKYSLSIAKAIAKNNRNHEIYIVLNGLFYDSIEPIRKAFNDLLPCKNICIFSTPDNVAAINGIRERRIASEYIRESFIASLDPDIVLVTSLFEGLVDDAVTSVKSFASSFPTAVILYDLIPYIFQSQYLNNPDVKRWYLDKIEHFSKADLLLSISAASRNDGLNHLSFSKEKIINISSAVDEVFAPQILDQKHAKDILNTYSLKKKIVMYTGGIDYRKNIEGLIEAYSMLPYNIRSNHQLAIICSINIEDSERLKRLIHSFGLYDDEVVFTGFVPEDHLVKLYNLAEVFVFPSKYEGFGLPALEAMSCGTATIGSNVSSIPEVIGKKDALFDPDSPKTIANKLLQVLTNEEFRKSLIMHGLEQARKFSWDVSAIRSIKALEQLYESKNTGVKPIFSKKRLKLAYVSPIPPEKSGIADYSAELLIELSKYYDITIVVEQNEVSDEWIKSNCKIENCEWLHKNNNKIDRILYHFGNSTYHAHMFDLLEKNPGVVVMHDFFLSSILAQLEYNENNNVWTKALYDSQGYAAVYDRFHEADITDVIWKYPANINIIKEAYGVIVHSKNTYSLTQKWYGKNSTDYFAIVPLLRYPCAKIDKEQARRILGISNNQFVVCVFGLLGKTKLNHRLIDAWKQSTLSDNSSCRLFFVGQNNPDLYGQGLINSIKDKNLAAQITITGWVTPEDYKYYLASADCAVQLRTLSRGETSAAVLDCMNYGVPTIVNTNGSFADLPDNTVWKLPDAFSDEDLRTALETLCKDDNQRELLCTRAREEILTNHSPSKCAKMYFETIETFYDNSKYDTHSLINAIAFIDGYSQSQEELIKLATAIALSQPKKVGLKQLFVDISELIQRDTKTGIQRVTRSILKEMIFNPPTGYRVEPVYASLEEPGYKYASNFTLKSLDCPNRWIFDSPIDYYRGDVFLGLDLQPNIVPVQQKFLMQIHNYGVKVLFILYDLLPILHAEFFYPEGKEIITSWINTIILFDGAVCISKAVARELGEWIQENMPDRLGKFEIRCFHLGADINNSLPSLGVPENAEPILSQLSSCKSFLMVGTVEPRKRQDQVLEAFEQLWNEGFDVNLVIVGKKGWMVDELCDRMKKHKENGNRFFWLEGISDEYLEKIYDSSTCLIAASEGEGFGLPLIEAAQKRVPIIARDIPVFREVADKYAYYFSGTTGEELANSIKEWMTLFNEDKHPKSDDMPWLTWKESTKQLLKAIGIDSEGSGSDDE